MDYSVWSLNCESNFLKKPENQKQNYACWQYFSYILLHSKRTKICKLTLKMEYLKIEKQVGFQWVLRGSGRRKAWECAGKVTEIPLGGAKSTTLGDNTTDEVFLLGTKWSSINFDVSFADNFYEFNQQINLKKIHSIRYYKKLLTYHFLRYYKKFLYIINVKIKIIFSFSF